MTTYDVATAVTGADGDELWPVFDTVFPGDYPDRDTWRAEVFDRHRARPGFRLARAYEEGRLVGFAHGHQGEYGQRWTDRAARVLAPDVASEWLGGHFDLVNLGVLAEARRRGVGRRLMREITRDLPQDRWTLMTTADADDPARHLYAAEGWQVIGPGLHDGQVIMGRRRA